MSYDVQFVDSNNSEVVWLPRKAYLYGGTYAMDGDHNAVYNITYNYSPHFETAIGEGGLRSLYGLTAEEVASQLDRAISMLGTDVHKDYWKPTEGNARFALIELRALASMVPLTSVLEGD